MTDNKFIRALQSRKVWAAIVGLVAILWTAYQSGVALDPDTVVTAIMGIVGAYIAATAYEDSQHAKANATVAAASLAATTPTPTVGIDANTVTVQEGK